MTQQNRRLEVAISKTINMGNYNSLKVHAGLSLDVADGVDIEKEYKATWNEVHKEINKALAAFKKG